MPAGDSHTTGCYYNVSAPSAATKKYLALYAEAEAHYVVSCIPNAVHYDSCLCIPAFDENAELLTRLALFAKSHLKCLFILVINQPARITAASKANLALVATIEKKLVKQQSHHNLNLYALNDANDLLVVDRYTQGNQIPSLQGVGQARKIAADIALRLIALERIRKPWIFCTDADVTLPANYFSAVNDKNKGSTNNIAAYLFPFQHVAESEGADKKLTSFTHLYERRINAYTAGLTFAGSPYAYHTLGSTLCISASHYAVVRGFPRRSAGEDFYLLNKLRKTGEIALLSQPVIFIDARQSTRTPFGTGAAVKTMLSETNDEMAVFYHPVLFDYLKTLLQWFSHLSATYAAKKAPISANDWQLNLREFGLLANQDDTQFEAIEESLNALDFSRGFSHCLKQTKTELEFSKQLFYWFDAFRTLKWLHHLRAGNVALSNLNEDEFIKQWYLLDNKQAT